MENDFELLITSFIKNKIGISNHFLTKELSYHLRQNLLSLNQTNSLFSAGTGNNQKYSQNNEVRNDSIYWLDRKHNDLYENEFLDQMDDFIKYLNKTCYTRISSCEFHYSLYEIGSFYKKHFDQFNNNSSRQYSVISYLNVDWKDEDGGELRIHQTEQLQNIPPTNGKTVLFKSNQLEHEVLITNKRRMSITGWLKCD